MTQRSSPPLGLALTVLIAAVNGCGHYRPALFADHAVVTAVRDDLPIALPANQSFDDREQISDIYLRRPLFDDVRPLEFPTAGDVNTFDEVAASSWYDPEGSAEAASQQSSPPVTPLTVLDEEPKTDEDALVVRDVRGLRYELLADPAGHQGLRTGAAVLGGYLLRGLGLRAPLAWIVGVPETAVADEASAGRLRAWTVGKAAPQGGLLRVSATLWPGGIDVGVTGDYLVRKDDPNDVVDHHNRRTLRAMKIFGHWLGWTQFGVRRTRDVYVGKPDEGHLVHYILGTNRAFGTQDLQATSSLDENSGSVWWRLVTLGLSAPTISAARRSAFSSLGYFSATLTPGDYSVSPPYSPFVRFTPADEYWAAKRLLETSDEALRRGLTAALLQHDAATHLAEVLRSRRQLLVAHAMQVVSPLDIAATSGRSVWLRDRAIEAGLAVSDESRYELEFLDAEGVHLSPSVLIGAVGPVTAVDLPTELSGLVVLHLRVFRRNAAAPRACDIHVMVEGPSVRIIALRH